MLTTNNYEKNYSSLPFEDVLREYRKQKTWAVFHANPHARILEIGSGPRPLFTEYDDFERMVVVEPGDDFYREASQHAAGDARIQVIHNLFEHVVDKLQQESFDIIVVGGFLHEIDNPGSFVKMLRQVCTPHTLVHSFVPNARSFHRLLAFEMGLIDTVYQKSENDVLFQRRTVFDLESFIQLFSTHGYRVEASGSYFIKPFTHHQMDQLITASILDSKVMNGLDKMIKYMPEYGAELFINARIHS